LVATSPSSDRSRSGSPSPSDGVLPVYPPPCPAVTERRHHRGASVPPRSDAPASLHECRLSASSGRGQGGAPRGRTTLTPT
jgi:hypothetical protein